MPVSKSGTRRRPLHEGIRCATCRQPVSKCRCQAFFLDPTTSYSSTPTSQAAEPEDLAFTVYPIVEGSVVSSSSGSPDTSSATPTATSGMPTLPEEDTATPAASSSPSKPHRARKSWRAGGLQATSHTKLRPLKRRRTRRSTRRPIRALILLGFLLISMLFGVVLFFTLPAPATIAVHPSSGARDEVVTVTAVTTTPAPLESQARRLIDTRSEPAQAIWATGIVHQPAAQATGLLIFYNIAPSSQQIRAGIVFTVAGGIQVISDRAVTVPAGNPPDSLGSITVSAHVQQTGAQGNIKPDTINGLCPCDNAGVSVKNGQFTGGQDAATYTVLTQADVDGIVNPERARLIQQATDGVKAQMRRTERLASFSCTASTSLDTPVGSRTAKGQVTVEATCQGEVYDKPDVEAIATAIFRQDMQRMLQKPDVLTGSPIAAITHTAILDQRRGTLSFLVHVRGWWMHALDTARLSQRLAGKTYSDAMSTLLSTPGILTASVQQRGSGLLRLPDDPRQITIQIVLPVVT